MKEMDKHKIVIVGNCQARPLKQIIDSISDEVDVIGTPIVHLLKDENESETKALLDQADTIITQVIADNYPCKYIQTSRLKADYPHKVVTILNLFYSGYTPDWLYVRIPGKGTLKGPMGDYHNLTIIEAWLAGKNIEQTTLLLFDEKFNQDKYQASVEASLAELSDRESQANVPIVDFIFDNLKKERLFFTFNHPSVFLLKEYARRILTTINIHYSKSKLLESMPEPLNQFIPALNPGVGFDFPIIKEFKGLEVEIHGDNITNKGLFIYTPVQLVQSYFDIYSSNEDLIKDKYGS
jgi:hypothetical protein